MSEATSEHHDVVPKEPSFDGRLQLKSFIYNGTTPMAVGTRRSARLQISPAPSPSLSESTSPAPPAAATASQKRKPSSRARGKPLDDDDDDEESPSPRKKRTRVSSSYAPPSTYAHLPPLTDVITPNLIILFIGLNPGVQTARSGHAYAHPSNLFWKLLYSSGITPVPCRPEEDGTLPARFSLGNTNIVSRPSRNGAELSRAELDAGVAVLEQKCRRWRPEAVCIVGKGIWESIFRVWHGRNLTRAEFQYGWQTERMGAVPPARDSAAVKLGIGKSAATGDDGRAAGEDGGSEEDAAEEEEEKVGDGPWEGSRVFVATSTSGLAATLRPEEKERIWKILGDWCVQRRKERAEEKTGIDV